MKLSSRLSRLAVEPKSSGGSLLFLFCPSDLTAPNKSHYSPLCHPERSRGICGAPRLPHKGLRSVSSPTESSSLRSRRNLGGAYFAHAARSFSTTEARQQGPRRH